MINRIESTGETGNHQNRAAKSLARSIDVHVGFHSRYNSVLVASRRWERKWTFVRLAKAAIAEQALLRKPIEVEIEVNMR